MRIVQKYFSVAELAWTYGFAESTIRGWIREGKFGPRSEHLVVGTDLRIPTSGALFFESMHRSRMDSEREAADQVRGRTLGEARRRALELQSASPDACTS